MASTQPLEALDTAERVCSKRGVRLTSLRRRVLEQILKTDGVIKAYDLIHALSSADRSIKPPTVYRSLAFLLEQGFIHRIESLNGFVACNHPGEAHETLLMICDGCGDIHEMEPENLRETLDHAAQAQGFSITGKVVELHGICRKCRDRPAAGDAR
ncbi:Zinc uptake regulation protein ZUR [Thioalkalivibrio nitratireducens DSM 14787]|uniref:Zinc uptake regulation protein ZUR n=1 Tax=Thioalkalivibrio nitratireducens (strain DSM 14787 / UNIQEM 213 / ALEN2) TaxID=1255043 RepID=L0E1M0_THIND|nr:transcriptional repressor [Thioalkalivibrio nitratireducens]AGA35193.1 Zinc uptake regulation protein ZUR [Thioalkalivibrio nitratireducens DSM 14787]